MCWSTRLLLKLQTSSMCLNGRWRGFASATKRLEMSITDPGWADRARQLLETTACWSDCQKPGPCQPPHSSRRSGRQWTSSQWTSRTVRRILARNGLHGRIVAQKPVLNKRQLRNRVAYAKAHSLMEGWTAEKWRKMYFSDESSVELHPKHRQYCYIQCGSAREICKVDGNIDSAKNQQILASQYISNNKIGQIFQQDGAPCHTSGSTMKFLRGKKIKFLQGWPAQSPDMNIIEHIWGRMKEEAWRTKSKNLEELWDACKVAFHAIPNDFINKLYDSLPNRMATVLQAKGTHTRY